MTRLDGRPPGALHGPPRWQPGDRVLGGYRVDALLGSGSFGQVYRVSVDAPVPRSFALKRLAAADSDARQACLRELQVWIDLPEHEHLVTLRFPHLDDEAMYLFADWIEGGSLAQRHAVNDIAKLLDIGIQLAWGLHACHCWELIHADVKPDNVFITAVGVVKLGDFGIARLRRLMATEEVPLGTPGFRSPEQALGKPLDARSDLWGWAATIRAIGRDLPPEAKALLRRCFEEDPAHRPESALAVADRLRQLHRQLLGTDYARPDPPFVVRPQAQPLERRGRYGEHWPAPAQDAGLPREGLGLRAQLVADLAAHDRQALALAQQISAMPGSDATRGDLTRQLARACCDLGVIHAQLGDALGEIQLNQRALATLDGLPQPTALDTLETSRTCISLGVSYQGQGATGLALAAFDRAVSMLRPLADEDEEAAWQLARAQLNRSVTLVDIGDGDSAVAAAESAVEIRRPIAARNPARTVGVALAQGNLANALREAGRIEDSVAAFDQAIETYLSAPADRAMVDRNLALTYSNRGTLRLDLGDPGAAIASFDAAMALYEPLAADSDDAADGLAWVTCNKGEALLAAGRPRDALACFERGVQGFVRLLPARPDLATELGRAWASTSQAQVALGLIAEALESARQAAAIFRRLQLQAPAAMPSLLHGVVLVALGLALSAAGEPAAACDAYREAIEILQQRHSLRPGWTTERELARAYAERSVASALQGDIAAALLDGKRALAHWDSLLSRTPAVNRAERDACARRLETLGGQGGHDRGSSAPGRLVEERKPIQPG